MHVHSSLINSIDWHVRDHRFIPRRTPRVSYFLIYVNLIHRSEDEDTNALHGGVSDNLATYTCIKLNNSLSSHVTFLRVIVASQTWSVNLRSVDLSNGWFSTEITRFRDLLLYRFPFYLLFEQDWTIKIADTVPYNIKYFRAGLQRAEMFHVVKYSRSARILFILELYTNFISTIRLYLYFYLILRHPCTE